VFDLDNTLYPARCALFTQVDHRIGQFVERHLGLDSEQSRTLRRRFHVEHGSTLRGLMTEHTIEPEGFLNFVHDIDYGVLDRNARLDTLLAALPGRKLIYTNGSTRHAVSVLSRLGITHHFPTIFDIAAADYWPKPFAEPYQRLIATAIIDPNKTVMVEDTVRNLGPAAACGMTTVWVRPEPSNAAPDFVHHPVADLEDWLARVLAERLR